MGKNAEKEELSLSDYARKVVGFRRELLDGVGCPLCMSPIETKKSKFHLVYWDFWKCTDESEDPCILAKEWNNIFESYEEFNTEED